MAAASFMGLPATARMMGRTAFGESIVKLDPSAPGTGRSIGLRPMIGQ